MLYVGIIEIGDGAKIGAGAIMLKDVPPCATVVGGSRAQSDYAR